MTWGEVIGYLVHPSLVNVPIPRPAILKSCTSSQAVWCRVKVTPLVERRISGYQVYGFAVHRTEELQIVPMKKSAVLDVQ